MTGYEIYCQWCRDQGHKLPTKAWWDNACAKHPSSTAHTLSEIERENAANQREIDAERREGWAYGE